MSVAPQRLDEQFPWDKDVLQTSLRRLMTILESRFIPLEAAKFDWEEATDNLTQIGLSRINEALAPAVLSITELVDLGFMTAPSTYSVALEAGNDKTFIIDDGPQRTNFKPTPFVYIQDNNNIDNWAVARLNAYDSDTGVLEVHIQTLGAETDSDPHTDWTISMSPAATPALFDILDDVGTMHADVSTKYADILTKWADIDVDRIAAEAAEAAAEAAAAAAATFNPSSYYTKAAADTLLAGKAATSHTHTAAQITDFNTAVDARSLQIGDVTTTVRNPGSNFLPLDGGLYTTATYPALQALLGNNYAQFGASTAPTMPAGQYYGLVYEAAFGLFLAGGTNGTTGALASSPDSTTWTSRDTTASRKWSIIASNGVKAMAINAASNTGNVVISSNGTTWTAATSLSFTDAPMDNFQGGLLWLPGASLWIAFSSGTTAPEIKTSANDGTSWQTRTSAFAAGPDTPGAAAVGNGIIVQLANNATGTWQTSTDGITWTKRTGGTWNIGGGQQPSIKFVNGLFVIAGHGGKASVWTSADGINWTRYQIPIALAPFGTVMSIVNYVAPYYVFVLYSSGFPIDTIVTTDFLTWRRNPNNIAGSVVGSHYKSVLNSGTLLFTSIGATSAGYGVVQKTSLDNSGTQFRVPKDESNVALSRWIKAL